MVEFNDLIQGLQLWFVIEVNYYHVDPLFWVVTETRTFGAYWQLNTSEHSSSTSLSLIKFYRYSCGDLDN